ncbi:5-amino-6-(5-phosphoribosylamino)uracil reductase / diaminohydroxyphosphoribosylaminopyrimidine deaminase RibD [Clostridium aceticum]|uniref:Riboflavin biosynthesis protein RibD n=1 Tax=Clostridium aceticum TaxID=84022 RepID=A0A0D8IBV0_9CLOT|nr:bifunctional diaminohydroxyphosphoribosylaminopyrimidine deaminase/5-amino-6-(5-phosphoribosylamino)uracil reductase RibD [Clostridium aceticum]AKL96952.1 5-amino-6-(5-phosphoribosylamino)uracil reductase / diaminohydroxyphosphoribosylaminopyrimidine deaminase RibD [Clostridium aceticum]KJF27422.1 riboflavin biosynthesis protein RibD [Clostridium aceticum]
MDQQYMQQALNLAKLGWGKTRPNPLVGAVITKNGEVIAEGYHHYYGGDHAEVDALKKINFSAEGATMYVNLEPCSHYGKTPPCVEAIIKSKIKKVVVALEDPNPKVAGNGIKILKNHGIEVVVGILQEEAIKLNEIFIKYILTQQPFCILKTAMTLDGKIASHQGDSKWITSEDAREHVHHIRDRVAGIMVGISTVLKDNPQLNTRIANREVSHPIRIIVDSTLRIPIDTNVIKTSSDYPTIVATTEKASKAKIHQLQDLGVEVLVVGQEEGKVNLKDLMVKLGEKKVDSILLEGGGTLNYAALESDIVDKVLCFIAPKIIGGKNAITSVEGEGKHLIKDAFTVENLSIHKFRKDILIEGYVRKG